jgi:hypothetical protein
MRTTFLILTAMLLGTSCKKKDDPAPAPPPAPTPTGTYYGCFTAEKLNFWTNKVPTGQAYLAEVFLFSSPKKETEISSRGENMGKVFSNNIQLQYNSSLLYYRDSTGTLSYSTQVSFQHTSTAVGSISYVSPDTFPAYPASLAAMLADTLDKTKDYTVPLTGINYFTKATIILYDGSLSLSGVTKTVTPGVTEVTFKPSDVTSIKPGYNFIHLSFSKYTDQTINGKLFRFENVSNSDFSVYVK